MPEREISTLKRTLLVSSLSLEANIQKANKELVETVRKATNLLSLAKRYIAQLTATLEDLKTKVTLLEKENTKV